MASIEPPWTLWEPFALTLKAGLRLGSPVEASLSNLQEGWGRLPCLAVAVGQTMKW